TYPMVAHFSIKFYRPKSSDIGKIFRGGHYSILSEYNRPAWRSVSNPNFRSSTIGFRLAE
ncbi:hypothetical protein, partial [uncultured Duncaniella sp.]|uniref:hypothetical protein n=1 Tax=uncultured Duncaniella sp. TaxID=2768039 RepID=UPI0027318180